MIIELRYQCFIHVCFGNYLGNIFLLFFLSFSDSCVWSVRTVILYMSGRYFWLSGRYDWFVQTSMFLWPLRGTTSRHHLSFVRMVNTVGLNRILPGVAHHFLLSFCVFLSSCAFSLCFLCVFLSCTCRLWILSPPQVCIYTLLLIF